MPRRHSRPSHPSRLADYFSSRTTYHRITITGTITKSRLSIVPQMRDVPYRMPPSVLARYCPLYSNCFTLSIKPGLAHWEAVKGISCYLKGTNKLFLSFADADGNRLRTATLSPDTPSCPMEEPCRGVQNRHDIIIIPRANKAH